MAMYPREKLELAAKKRLYPLEIDGVTYQWNLYKGFYFTTGDVVHVKGTGFSIEPHDAQFRNYFANVSIDGIGVVYADPPDWISDNARRFWNQRKSSFHNIDEHFGHVGVWSKQFVFHGQQNDNEVKAIIVPGGNTFAPLTFDRSSFVECFASSKRARIGKRKLHLDELFLPCGNNLGRLIREDPMFSYVMFSVPAQLIIHQGKPAQRWLDEQQVEK